MRNAYTTLLCDLCLTLFIIFIFHSLQITYTLNEDDVQKHKNPNTSNNYIITKNTHRISRFCVRAIRDSRHIL